MMYAYMNDAVLRFCFDMTMLYQDIPPMSLKFASYVPEICLRYSSYMP